MEWQAGWKETVTGREIEKPPSRRKEHLGETPAGCKGSSSVVTATRRACCTEGRGVGSEAAQEQVRDRLQGRHKLDMK